MTAPATGLGLLRELAAQGLLHRFDYLSTVSGGSYIGAYYGGLFAKRRKTLPFNGYEAQVGQLYAGMDLKKFF